MTRRWIPLAILCLPLSAQPGADFFEAKIRPVLATKCFGCHSSTLSSPAAGLRLDTRAGLQRVTGRILQAIRYTDPDLQMPPTGKLPDAVIADFEQWIAAGALDPRVDAASRPIRKPAPLKGMSIEDGRKWWAFQPVHEIAAPKVKNAAWPKTKIDSFVSGQARRKRADAFAAGRRPNAGRARLRRPGRAASRAMKKSRPSSTTNRRTLTRSCSTAAGVAALRRALGPALDGCRALSPKITRPRKRPTPRILSRGAIATG